MIELRDPLLALAALAAVPVYLLSRRPAGRLVFSSLGLLPAGGRSLRARLSFLPAALVALAAGSLGIALAGPRIPDQTTRVKRKGIAIIMAVDCSGSMRALDLSEPERERTRLDAVKEVFHDFVAGGRGVAGRPDDAIGIVSFARYADCRSPLTLDHRNLLLIARDLDFAAGPAEDGTALGDGLALAIERLRESRAESKVVILLTDGVQNAGETTPRQAGELARTLGVKVYAIGAGTEGFAPVRVEDPLTGRTLLRRVPVEIDEEALQEVAARTGGRYFRATDAEGLRHIYAEIDRLERTEIGETRYLEYEELYGPFAAAGASAAAIGLLLGASIFRRLP